MDTYKDYYRILEVHPAASVEMIERAKRLLLQRYHPDKNPDRLEWASGRTRLVLEAHGVLSDADARKAYDSARRERSTSARQTSGPGTSERQRGPRSSSARPRRASPKPQGRPRARKRPPAVDDAPPGYRTVVCGVCGRPSQVRERIPLCSVICGGCGRPLRQRLSGRVRTQLLRIDGGLERLRAGLVAVLSSVGIPTPRRDKEKSSH